MKKALLLLFAIFVVYMTRADEEEKLVQSKIKEVRVFINSAQVFREGQVSLSSGLNKIIIPEVSPNLNQATIQASGLGNFTILDVKYFLKPIYKNNKELEPEIKKLNIQIRIIEDSVLYMRYDLDKLAYSHKILENEKKMILENGILKKREDTNSIEVLEETMVYLRKKLNKIESDLITIKIREHEMNKIYTEKTSRLARMKTYRDQLVNRQNSRNNTNVPQIILTCFAEKQTQGTIGISYLVYGCGWTPAYDFKVIGADKPVKLTKRAMVYQNSKEDWNNVKLTLSTHTPNFSRTKPVLNPWNLSYSQNYHLDNRYVELNEVGVTSQAKVLKKEKDEEGMLAMTTADLTEKNSNIVFTEYRINLPFSIPSDGQQHAVPISNDEIKTSFVYYLVPKIDPKAYVIAKLTGWEDKKIQPANANLYYENTYMGQTYINPNIVKDTLEVAFGYDDNIVSERKKIEDKDKGIKILDKAKTISIQIKVKNNNNYRVNVELVDQIPISSNNKVKVVLNDSGGAELNKKTGQLTWKIPIEPNTTKTLTFSYTIKGS